MYAFFINLINALIRGFGKVLQFVFVLLPDSPFQKYIIENSVIHKYADYINYFIPISMMLVIFEAWCSAIGVYYLYQIVLRWAKAIN